MLFSEKTMDKERDTSKNSEQLNNLPVLETNPAREFFDFVIDLLKTGLIVFILAIILRYLAVQPYIVDGESMMPNYHNHEYLLAEKVSYLIGQPERGDVIVFKYPKNTSVNYIKRVIGLPGDTVKIYNNEVVIVNADHPAGFVLDESSYLPKENQTLMPDGDPFSQVLGTDQYFVLGDNREHSSDSRDWGILPKNDISGRAWLTLLPFDRASVHKRVTYSLGYPLLLPSLALH